MKPAWRETDRAAAVRGTAAGWLKAALIDAATLVAVERGWPRNGPRLGPVWRSLVFVFVAVGIATTTSGIVMSSDLHGPGGFAALLIVLGAALALATELLLERTSFAPTGAEAATSLFAVAYLSIAPFALFDSWHWRDDLSRQAGFPLAAAFLGAAAWRWGFRLYAGAAAVFALLFAAQFSPPWLLWTATAGLLAGAANRLLSTSELAPSHRGGLELVRAVALAALYAGVNYFAIDHGWIREIGRIPGAPRSRPGDLALLAAAVGSALFPLALLAWGIGARNRVLLGLGVLAAACSLVTIRFYVHLAPLWVVLAVSGATLAAAALLLERWLKGGRDGERHGFTTAPLYDEGRRERLLPMAAAVALAPAARDLPEEPRGVPGAGGGFGGGGATGQF